MWNQTSQKDDVEAGKSLLYPLMQESPELRWDFIRKVYSIITLQLLVTIAVASVVVTVHPIAAFFTTTWTGLAINIVIILIPIIVMCPLYFYRQKHPMNFFLLGIFTVGFGFGLGVVCAYYSGSYSIDFLDWIGLATWKVILETLILTALLVIGLTLYTFWAAKRGDDFKFLPAFIFGCLIVLLLFILIQPTVAAPKDEKAVNAALCSGAEIETLKKLAITLSSTTANAGTNRAASICTSLNTRKLDEDTENLTRKMINEKPQIIQEFESGKAIPNQQIISKLDRALGTKLRGKK
ncbi:Bax inhibitor-1 family protein [Abeliophyllum distichum]|uniref:Bax inhibitor-1 family protein n=1 Tax=Abeliophyllum distichum TaxID=126358 RepID=A0ABD1TDA9_9LAMI